MITPIFQATTNNASDKCGHCPNKKRDGIVKFNNNNKCVKTKSVVKFKRLQLMTIIYGKKKKRRM